MSTLPTSDHHLLSTVVGVRGDIPTELVGLVKYATHFNRCAKAHPERGTRSTAHEKWLDSLATTFKSTTAVFEIDAGRVWGLDVSVDCFLTGPLAVS